ncbi:hypothetical protein GCM10011581_31680 [Saccharopolyspora subtropica]|uniref:Cation-transporting P-type ATPase N-terminal domain-containing protein n=1 Tax=Saccharopolyspora thermophila TaxID=89367 RepID=A0A917NE90_9PSEU|nr:hypothetical protein GCM10011581_31680 [Saccharopolyspora subtropica]
MEQLHTDPSSGLTEEEAARRRDQVGPNMLPTPGSVGPVGRLLRQLRSPLVSVLLVAGAVTLAVGEGVDASVIFGVVVVNMVIGFVQESKAESALEALRTMVRTEARVVRGGQKRTVSAEDLATPLTRKIAWFSKVLTVVILALALVAFGTGVVRGQDWAEMFTAAVALAVGAIPEGLPAAVTITLAIGVVRMARRRAVIRHLPAVETLGSTTVIGTDKTGTLTENQMTVRSVWTPDGRFEVTGSGCALQGATLGPTGSAALRWCLLAGAACNDAALVDRDGRPAVVGDPTEGALLVVARKAEGIVPADIAETLPRVATIPFSSDRAFMATLHDVPGHGRVVLAKGAVERLLALCGAEMASDGARRPLDRCAVLAAAEELAGAGLRVLATAMRPVRDDEPFEAASLDALVLTGLHVMFDPPRPDAAEAVRACREAGIQVKMITGDHVATAVAIAARLGFLEDRRPGDALTGADLAALPQEEWPEAASHASVFARVSPEQKLRLVEAFQSRGDVVAMTGDGVNDAPALRRADIGVAMGRSGTEAAKESADMVLTDDDFATIEAAVEEGRGVFDNLTKFIVWTLPTNLGEGLVILAAIVLGSTLPILHADPVDQHDHRRRARTHADLRAQGGGQHATATPRPARTAAHRCPRAAHPAGLGAAGRWRVVAVQLGTGSRCRPCRGTHRRGQPLRRDRAGVPVQLPVPDPADVAPRTVQQPVAAHQRGHPGGRAARDHLPAGLQRAVPHRADRRRRVAADRGDLGPGLPGHRPRQAPASSARPPEDAHTSPGWQREEGSGCLTPVVRKRRERPAPTGAAGCHAGFTSANSGDSRRSW